MGCLCDTYTFPGLTRHVPLLYLMREVKGHPPTLPLQAPPLPQGSRLIGSRLHSPLNCLERLESLPTGSLIPSEGHSQPGDLPLKSVGRQGSGGSWESCPRRGAGDSCAWALVGRADLWREAGVCGPRCGQGAQSQDLEHCRLVPRSWKPWFPHP